MKFLTMIFSKLGGAASGTSGFIAKVIFALLGLFIDKWSKEAKEAAEAKADEERRAKENGTAATNHAQASSKDEAGTTFGELP